MDEILFEVVKLTGCKSCGAPVIYFGPAVFANSKRFCSDTCASLDDLRTPGYWLDASEMMEGGCLYNRLPEIWTEPNQ